MANEPIFPHVSYPKQTDSGINFLVLYHYSSLFIIIATCTNSTTCQAGGDNNKECPDTNAGCVCKAAHYADIAGLCVPDSSEYLACPFDAGPSLTPHQPFF